MTGKEKFRLAMSHQEGPILIDIGGTSTTGIHCTQVEKLREYYGLEKKPIIIIEPGQMLGYVDEDLKEAMGVQTTPFWGESTMFGFKNENFKEYLTPWGQTVLVPQDFVTTTDNKGDTYIYAGGDKNYAPTAKMPEGGFYFDNIVRTPEFDEETYNVEDNFEEFQPILDETLKFIEKEVEKVKNTDDVVVGNLGGTGIGDIALVPGPQLKSPKGIRDIEEWYVSTLIRQEELHEIFSYQTKIALENFEKMAPLIGDTLQVAFTCGTDLGTQKGPFCSNELFRELYAPYYKKINDWIHNNTSWKIFKHCCGSIKDLIPELVEVGFDILNPVQWTADNMDKEELKSEFGDNIVFWGGGVDTQKTLPFGTSKQVYDEVIECCRVFAKDGGFVFNTIHNIQPLVPVENIVAMVDAVKDYNAEYI